MDKLQSATVEQLKTGAMIAFCAVGGMLLFFFVLKLLPSEPVEASTPATSIEEMTQKKLGVEKSLQSNLSKLTSLKKEVENMETQVSILRNQRDDLAEKINMAINPEYTPEKEVKK